MILFCFSLKPFWVSFLGVIFGVILGVILGVIGKNK